jgi:hypothetical protein
MHRSKSGSIDAAASEALSLSFATGVSDLQKIERALEDFSLFC